MSESENGGGSATRRASHCSTDLEVVVTCTEKPIIGMPQYVSGWGDDGNEAKITGQVKEIRVDRNGKSQFGIRILDNGEIIITDYGHMCFETSVPQNVRFKPARPWKANP